MDYPSPCANTWGPKQRLSSGIDESALKRDDETVCTIHGVDIVSEGRPFVQSDVPIVANFGQEGIVWDQLLNSKVLAYFYNHQPTSWLKILFAECREIWGAYNVNP